ncbi:MAG: hypothetical protein OEY22_01615 [Candidatus Bathyarchaeota archaeon]|nr:hypothetical protein [Candidatus Bathyarchaeota archaeon]MDH5788127.1 hypothetical protein [Candidatus Bathyarchaeota archaeon]
MAEMIDWAYVVCEKETNRRLFKDDIVPTFICSKECLLKYFKPLGRETTVIQETFGGSIEQRDYWFQ